ncbi:MAG: alpha/beta fold hydrolase [Oscillospiraceae bacterium]|nr:alpha/beta fold hydrolase [Oscillospiraceae bacterium]
MNQLCHQEYIRVVDGAKTAVLCIHGIVGSPNHFREIIPLLPEDWSVYCIMLDGHGKRVEDFSETSMEKWKIQVAEVLHKLCYQYENVIIVAHSMGTLLALNESQKHPDRINKMILLAVPLKVYVHPSLMSSSMKLVFDRINEDDVIDIATRDACSVEPDKQIWKYLGWIPRFLELFELIRDTRKIIPEISVPTYVFQSKNDELVLYSAKEYLKGNANIKVQTLENSGHFYYSPTDEAYLHAQIKEILGI